MQSGSSDTYRHSLAKADADLREKMETMRQAEEESALSLRVSELEAKVASLTARNSLKDRLLGQQAAQIARLNHDLSEALNGARETPEGFLQPHVVDDKTPLTPSGVLIAAKNTAHRLPSPAKAPLRVGYRFARSVYRKIKK